MKETTPKKFACLVNPQAANKRWLRKKKLRDFLLRNLSGKVYDVLHDKNHTIEFARNLSQEYETIVVIGGDGTIADVIQGIIQAKKERPLCLGIIPFGSGNAFRKAFEIPKNPKEALAVLSKGVPREIDLIEVEGKFAGFISIGATARVTQEKAQNVIPGFLGHLIGLRALFSWPKKKYCFELYDGLDDKGNHFTEKKLELKLYDCVIAKTSYFGYNWRVAPYAQPDDGYLDITFFEVGLIGTLLFFPLIYFGLFQKTQKHYKAKKVVIEGKSFPIQYNGEFLGVRDRIEVNLYPRALKVICPH